jgi:hypothetical protein
MKCFSFAALLLFTIAGAFGLAAEPPKAAPTLPINRVRFFPAAGHEQAMVGGKITGSNVSDRDGFEPIAGAEITAVPTAGQWLEITFPNTKLYRWVRYEAPAGSHGNVAELEFYSGNKLMPGRTFGTFGWHGLHNWPRAFDKQTDTYFESDIADGQYVGIDVGEAATAQSPRLLPPPSDKATSGPVEVTLRCATPGAVVRYSFTGAPGPDEGTVYTSPLKLDHLTTLFAVAFKEGMPPSPVSSAAYLGGTALKPGLHSFHVGNSLTASTLRFPEFARAAGYDHEYHAMLKNGGNTTAIWQNSMTTGKADWDKEFGAMSQIDHFSVQPRLPGFTDEELTKEAESDVKFFDLARSKSPEVQPWIYSEWPSRRPGFNGWPPLTDKQTYEDACAALFQCSEIIQSKVSTMTKAGKHPRILPCTLAVAHFRSRLEQGLIPGLTARDFDPVMFYDNVHPGDMGRYLLCLTWFAAFYGESPVGKIPPVNMNLTAAQAEAVQHLAWDVVKNYPDCGLYEEGTTPCAKPEFVMDRDFVTLKSATPGVWFRYTLDGTVATRAHGYIYCGKITVPSGASLKALAYKSGMADSEISSR